MNPNVNDSVKVSEYVVVDLFTPPQPQVPTRDYSSVVDSSNRYSDLVATREQLQLLSIENVSVSDSSTLTESIKLLNEENIKVSDSSTTSENIVLLIPTLFIITSDSSTTSENLPTPQIIYGVDVEPGPNYTINGVKVV